jgi:hypothetical protein
MYDHKCTHIHTHTYSERENKVVLVSLFERTMGDSRGKENVSE